MQKKKRKPKEPWMCRGTGCRFMATKGVYCNRHAPKKKNIFQKMWEWRFL